MANKNQPDRWKSLILAAALAVAGTLFVFDKLGSFMQTGNFLSHAFLHSAPMLLVVVGVSLIVADLGTTHAKSNRPREGRYEQ
jgi:hypothetical protein